MSHGLVILDNKDTWPSFITARRIALGPVGYIGSFRHSTNRRKALLGPKPGEINNNPPCPSGSGNGVTSTAPVPFPRACTTASSTAWMSPATRVTYLAGSPVSATTSAASLPRRRRATTRSRRGLRRAARTRPGGIDRVRPRGSMELGRPLAEPARGELTSLV